MGVSSAVKEARLSQPVEISAVRKTDHGPGRYFVCLREANPSTAKSKLVYSIFFDDDIYKGARQSVLSEDCEHQQYLQMVDKP